jgi:cell division protein ZapA (FtsZ GTPase activity inhibitor)
MEKQTNKYKVTIFGEPYTLISDESEQHIAESAKVVDGLMSDLAKRAGIADVKKLAVLVALQCSSQLQHSKSHVELLEFEQTHLTDLLSQALNSLIKEDKLIDL